MSMLGATTFVVASSLRLTLTSVIKHVLTITGRWKRVQTSRCLIEKCLRVWAAVAFLSVWVTPSFGFHSTCLTHPWWYQQAQWDNAAAINKLHQLQNEWRCKANSRVPQRCEIWTLLWINICRMEHIMLPWKFVRLVQFSMMVFGPQSVHNALRLSNFIITVLLLVQSKIST